MKRITLMLVLAALAAPAQAEVPYQALQRRIIEVSEQVKPSVVHIEAIVKVNDRRNQVTGSGVIAAGTGDIITNHHVVDRAEKVTVTIPGHKKKYPAEIIGTDKQTDIALLRIKPDHDLAVAGFGSDADLSVGQWVIAVGNPYGLDGTVSFGIVSAKGRNLEIPHLLNDFIQTDAMIDRGSSGGPLVDLEGRVVGINSRGQGRGIGFTIPIDTALDVVRQIDEGGIERGWLGITIQPLDRDLATYLASAETTGVIVNSVSSGSPADRAGLQSGDIITHFDDYAVEAEKDEDLGNFQRRVARLLSGSKPNLGILRAGKPMTIAVEIASQPKVEPEEAETDDGFHVQEITEHLYRDQRLDSRKGAYVSFVARGSPASEAGLLPGDVISAVEGEKIENLEGFQSAMSRVEELQRFLILAQRGEETKYLLVKRRAGLKPSTDDPPVAGRVEELE